jgi:hypothetical protein
MCLVSSIATASPIRISDRQFNEGHFEFLSNENLAVLASRNDRGWHLGWFARDGEWDDDLQIFTNLPDVAESLNDAAMGRLVGLPAGSGSDSLSIGLDTPSNALVPEPDTILLIGTGLLTLVAPRLRGWTHRGS